MVAVGALYAGLIPIPIPVPIITATMAPSTMATAVSIITTAASRYVGAVPIDLIGSDDRSAERSKRTDHRFRSRPYLRPTERSAAHDRPMIVAKLPRWSGESRMTSVVH